MINKYSVSKTASIMKETRKEMGREYTQEKMAELLKLKNRQSYANFENGYTLPNWEQILELCNIFECDIGYLIGEHITKRRVNADVQEVTGLSEIAITKLKAMNGGNKWTRQTDTLNQIIACDKFGGLIGAMAGFAQEDEHAVVSDFIDVSAPVDDAIKIARMKKIDVRAMQIQNTLHAINEYVREQLYLDRESEESLQLSYYQHAAAFHFGGYALTPENFDEIIMHIDNKDYTAADEVWERDHAEADVLWRRVMESVDVSDDLVEENFYDLDYVENLEIEKEGTTEY